MEITFSIVGSAGRQEDGERLSKHHFDAACLIASELLYQFEENNYKITCLVSGGAAFIDHVAVRLFLDKKVPHLRLFLPCEFVSGMFHDSGISNDAGKNPGGTANYYHSKFKRKTGIDSLSELQIAKREGAEMINVDKGFFARNALVAKSDFILACTFGNKQEVKDGGTAHTIKCYLDRVRKEGIFDKSFHYDLNSGELFIGCTVPKPSEEDSKFKKNKYYKNNAGLPQTFSNKITNVP